MANRNCENEQVLESRANKQRCHRERERERRQLAAGAGTAQGNAVDRSAILTMLVIHGELVLLF